MQTALCGFAQVCASTYGTPLISLMPAQHCAGITETPRRPTGAGGAERSEPVRLTVYGHHTRSLCDESPAQTAQWRCWPDHFWIGSIGAKFANLSDAAGSAKRPRADARRDRPAGHRRRRSSNANGLCWRILAEPTGVSRDLKYMARARIPEFESYMPSH